MVAKSYGVSYEPNDVVRIIVGSRLAWSAVVIAFLVPLVLMLACLFVVVNVTGNEVLGCLVTLALMGVYFLGVWLMRDRLERNVEFTIERLY